jgi:hypothetical protein
LSQTPIWSQRSITHNKMTLQFQFDAAPDPPTPIDNVMQAQLKAQAFIDEEKYREAASVLFFSSKTDALSRRILLECLLKIKDTSAIVLHFSAPQSTTETISLLDALWVEKQHSNLKNLLLHPEIANSSDPSIVELRQKYMARLVK